MHSNTAVWNHPKDDRRMKHHVHHIFEEIREGYPEVIEQKSKLMSLLQVLKFREHFFSEKVPLMICVAYVAKFLRSSGKKIQRDKRTSRILTRVVQANTKRGEGTYRRQVNIGEVGAKP